MGVISISILQLGKLRFKTVTRLVMRLNQNAIRP